MRCNLRHEVVPLKYSWMEKEIHIEIPLRSLRRDIGTHSLRQIIFAMLKPTE